MPTPNARCLAGNHSATAFAAAGQLPGSASPSKNRHAAREDFPTTAACSIPAADHTVTKSANPHRVPSRSTTYPEPAYPMA